MKFNLPLNKDFELKVGAHIIHVFFVDDDHEAFHQDGIEVEDAKDKKPKDNKDNDGNNEDDYESCEDSELMHGCWIPETNSIYIRKDDSESMKTSTFFHEIFHVFQSIYSVSISHKDLNLAAEIMTQVLYDNFSQSKKKRK